jgi:hypothetical protein
VNFRDRLLLAALGAGFAAFFLWSVLFETILPLIERGDKAGLARNLLGIPLVLGGTAGFVWGAWRLLRAFFDPEQGWQGAGRLLLLSSLLIALGGFLTS